MPFNPTLKTKMSLAFIILGTVLLCIIATLTYGYFHVELKKSISIQQTILVDSIALQLDDRLELIHEQLKRFGEELDTATLNDPTRLHNLLHKEDSLLVFFNAGMLVVDPAGKIMAEHSFHPAAEHDTVGHSSHPERIGSSIPKEYEYFQGTLAKKLPFISSPFEDTLSKEPVIAFTVPILDLDGTLRAILVGQHKLWSSKFLSGLAEIHIGETGYLFIIDEHRDMVLHPDKSRVYERIRPGINQGLELALKNFEGTMENADSLGIKGLSSFKHLSAAPWIVCVHYPLKEIYQPLYTAVRYFLLILFTAGILSVLIIRSVTHRMISPLLKLTRHVSNIDSKQGEDRLISIESRDEIGLLARSFNTMINEIDNRQRKLDQQMNFVESLVTNSAAPIFVLDANHRIIYWNKALEKLTGFKAGDMKGTDRHWKPFYGEKRPTLADIVLDSTDETLCKLYDNYRQSRLIEGAFQAEGWYRFADTGRHYLFFQASPIKNSDGVVVGAVETLEDLTEAKQIEEMLNQQYRFLQEIIDAIPNPVYYKDRLGRYIGCNHAFEIFLGSSKKEILGKSPRDLTAPDAAAEHERMDKECFHSGVQQTYESTQVHADGTKHTIIVTKAPFFNQNGKPGGLVGTLIDITERHAMEEQVRKLSQAVEQSPVSIIITDTAGIIEYVNPKFCLLTGYSHEEVIGQKPQLLKSGNMPDEFYADLWLTISSGREWRGEFYNRKKNGELFWEQASISPLTDHNGHITHYLGVKEDITERKTVEMALNESETRLNNLVNCAQDAIIMLAPNNTISMWNDSAARIFGYSFEEAKGRDLHTLILPERYRNQHLQAFEKFVATGEGEAMGRIVELFGLRKNGEEFPLELALSSAQINGQRHAIGIIRDITIRRQAEQALAESKTELEVKHAELETLFGWVEAAKQEWEQTLDSLRDLVILTDPAGRIRRCNRLLCQLANRSHDEIIGTDWSDILTAAGFTFSSTGGTSGEVVHNRSKRLYNMYVYDIRSPDTDAVTGRVMSLVDTTELRSVTEELQKAYDELQTTQMKVFQQEKLASIGQLAAGVAHEINNPMGFISSNLGTLGKYVDRMKEFISVLSTALADSPDNTARAAVDEQRKQLKIDFLFDDCPHLIAESQEGAQRVRKIVQDLKSFSRVDDADQKYADINECIDSTINIAWNEIKYVATLTKDYGEILPVLCYPQQINQVFMNLLVNAAHAIEGQGEIRVRTWQEGDSVCASVSDSGCGISEENQKRIFEPFFTTKKVGMGTGLGLSISYDIVKKHHGELIVESEVGKGTTFTVRIPASGTGENT